MSIKPFVPCTHPALAKPAQLITDLHQPLVQQAKQDLKDSLAVQHQRGIGVGIAAGQIGVPLAMFVIGITDEQAKQRDAQQSYPMTVYLNPNYKPVHEQKIKGREGCFSFPGLVSEQVNRYQSIYFQALDENGQLVEFIAEGFLARVLQHETDHCRGLAYLQRVPKSLTEIHAWAEQCQRDPQHAQGLDDVLSITAIPDQPDWPALINWLKLKL